MACMLQALVLDVCTHELFNLVLSEVPCKLCFQVRGRCYLSIRPNWTGSAMLHQYSPSSPFFLPFFPFPLPLPTQLEAGRSRIQFGCLPTHAMPSAPFLSRPGPVRSYLARSGLACRIPPSYLL